MAQNGKHSSKWLKIVEPELFRKKWLKMEKKRTLQAKMAENGKNACYNPNSLKMIKTQLTSENGSKW